MNHHTDRQELSDVEKSILDAWMVYHGINIYEVLSLNFNGCECVQVRFRDEPDMTVTLDLDIPAWL